MEGPGIVLGCYRIMSSLSLKDPSRQPVDQTGLYRINLYIHKKSEKETKTDAAGASLQVHVPDMFDIST